MQCNIFKIFKLGAFKVPSSIINGEGRDIHPVHANLGRTRWLSRIPYTPRTAFQDNQITNLMPMGWARERSWCPSALEIARNNHQKGSSGLNRRSPYLLSNQSFKLAALSWEWHSTYAILWPSFDETNTVPEVYLLPFAFTIHFVFGECYVLQFDSYSNTQGQLA